MNINATTNFSSSKLFHSSVDRKKDDDDSGSKLTVHSKPSQQKKEDGVLKSLNNQINMLQEEQKKLATNPDLTPSEKDQKSKDIAAQIADIKSQINTRKIEIEKEQREKEIQKAKEKQASQKEQAEKQERPDSLSSKETDTLTKISSLMSDVASLNKVRTHASGEVHRIQGAIAANQSRNMTSADALGSKLSKAQSTADSISQSMAKKYGEIQSTIKDYLKVQKEERENPNKKDKENEDDPLNTDKPKTSFNKLI